MEKKFFICKKCGNLVGMLKDGGAPLFCCGQEMEALRPNSIDASKEKHVPVVTHEGDLLHVQVGEVLHPMLENHYIQWIALVTEEGFQVRYLKPGEEPKAVFADVPHGVVYEYCNLHGLWKCEF